jgi:hypothetical protein
MRPYALLFIPQIGSGLQNYSAAMTAMQNAGPAFQAKGVAG